MAFLSVGLGAFGAHGLNQLLTENNRLANWETAAQYHMYHALASVLIGILGYHLPQKELLWAGWLFVIGTLLFSGSLYVLSVTNVGKWGAVTPFGGLCFLAGWVLVLIAAYKA